MKNSGSEGEVERRGDRSESKLRALLPRSEHSMERKTIVFSVTFKFLPCFLMSLLHSILYNLRRMAQPAQTFLRKVSYQATHLKFRQTKLQRATSGFSLCGGRE